MENYDFSGWATRNDLLCGDGRTIRKDAFKENDGKTVPLIWNHDHTNPEAVLGHALLENRDEGVYAYCKFNDSKAGQNAKVLVEHGDVRSLSIWANKLKHVGSDVIHGVIRELSLVLAGANPGAFIESVMAHGEDEGDNLIVNYDENALLVYSSENSEGEHVVQHSAEKEDETVAEEAKKEENKKDDESKKEKTVAEVIDSMTEEQKNVLYGLVGQALADGSDKKEDTKNIEHSEGGTETMKQNAFDQETVSNGVVLSHSDEEAILELAKKSSVGTFQEALKLYVESNETLAHGLDLGDTETLKELLPDPKLMNPGAPEILGPDQSWVMAVINKIHKSPYSRVRTRYADARAQDIRDRLKAKAYKKGEEKKLTTHIKLLGRSFDPQTIYIKDEINRDDIIDITDFDIVAYHKNMMKSNLYETLATTVLIGDGREDTDPDKIKEDHIRSIWHDDELYTMHVDVDIEAMRKELQGTDTDAHFSENYIYAEAIIQQALYSRENFKGSGRPDFYCTPHLVNVMLLARDFNGRRIYASKSELAQALNVGNIYEIEQLEGKTRETDEGATKKLLGLFVNLADYQFGSTKGGEVTSFEQFDIDFNKHKYLMEARLSGALTKPYAAIALELPVVEAQG